MRTYKIICAFLLRSLFCSEFTDKFADGNIAKGWESLVKHHLCNDYCTFFELDPPLSIAIGACRSHQIVLR